MLKIRLTSTYFSFEGKFYRLTDGVAMGSPVSSIVANLFMENLEDRATSTAGELRPRISERYVDNVFSIVKRKSAKALLDHINELDAQIEFTMEREQEGMLPFLDVAVRRSDTGILRTAV